MMIEDEINVPATEARIRGLYAALRELEGAAKPRPEDYESLPPWRYGERSEDRVAGVQTALMEIQDEIIGLEHSFRDPVQDAEMRAEINAGIAMSGNWNDSASDYMHTPLEEELFQRGIERQVEREYMDERGYDYWSGPCPVCGGLTDIDDTVFVMGFDTCNHCYEEAVAWLHFIGFVTNHPTVIAGRYSNDYSLKMEDDDDE
jgi:hypothetical protein